MGQGPGEVGSAGRFDDRDYDRDLTVSNETEVTALPGDEVETAEIRAEIEETRAGMSQTIDQITERLSPSNIKEQVKDSVMEQVHEVKETVRDATIGRAEDMVRYAGETVEDVRGGFVETIRANPIPAALAGLGLGWLWMNRRSAPRSSGGRGRYWEESRGSYGRGYEGRGGSGQHAYYSGGTGNADRSYQGGGYASGGYQARSYQSGGYQGSQGSGGMMSQARDTAGNVVDQARDTAGNVVGQAQETASNIASSAQETAGQVVDTVQETAGQVYDQAQYQYRRVENTISRQLSENPLVVGAVALALGTAVGLALPETERENELMGDARDTLIDRVQDVASDTFERVQEVAGQVATQAQPIVSQAAQQVGDEAKRSASEAAGDVANQARRSTT